MGRLHLDRLPVLSALTAILSNLVSNVPAVVVLRPFIDSLVDPQRAWQTVAMASTLAGNLTVLGSIANLIVVQRGHQRRRDRLVGLLPGRRAIDIADVGDRDILAVELTGTPAPGRTGSAQLHLASLDAVNFLLADVRGALGPYLNMFLFDNPYRPGRCPCSCR